jgi:hypothetical protein
VAAVITSAFAVGLLLVQTASDQWEPGIGDPTFMGWLTVFAYFGASFLCLRATRVARGIGAERRLVLAWGLLTAGMIFLGFNKQLDLQSLVTVIGRRMAFRGGWYARRHIYQRWFIEGLLAAGLLALAIGGFVMRRHLREFWLAGCGAVFIVVFVMVRASSFHHVDLFLRDGPGGVRMNWILELSGIACIAIAARRYTRAALLRWRARARRPR